MKIFKLGFTGIILIGLGGLMAITNPGKQDYQQYASETINSRLKQQVCDENSQQMGSWLQSHCHTLVDTASPHLAQVIDRQTKRQNFLLFSIYQTDFSGPEPLPNYHFATVGLFDNFFTYQAEKI
jgi:hypothetical protein